MGAKTFKLSILTPGGTIYQGDISSLVVPAALGYLGILANHAPLIATLLPGRIIIKDPQGKSVIFESKEKGALEVLKNNVTLLADSVLRTYM